MFTQGRFEARTSLMYVNQIVLELERFLRPMTKGSWNKRPFSFSTSITLTTLLTAAVKLRTEEQPRVHERAKQRHLADENWRKTQGTPQPQNLAIARCQRHK